MERWRVAVSFRTPQLRVTHARFLPLFPSLFLSSFSLSLCLSFFIHSCLPIRLSVHLSSILSLFLSLFFNHLTSPPSHPLLILLYIYIYILHKSIRAYTLSLSLLFLSLSLFQYTYIYIYFPGWFYSALPRAVSPSRNSGFRTTSRRVIVSPPPLGNAAREPIGAALPATVTAQWANTGHG